MAAEAEARVAAVARLAPKLAVTLATKAAMMITAETVEAGPRQSRRSPAIDSKLKLAQPSQPPEAAWTAQQALVRPTPSGRATSPYAALD
jgi:hypothetical protein